MMEAFAFQFQINNIYWNTFEKCILLAFMLELQAR